MTFDLLVQKLKEVPWSSGHGLYMCEVQVYKKEMELSCGNGNSL